MYEAAVFKGNAVIVFRADGVVFTMTAMPVAVAISTRPRYSSGIRGGIIGVSAWI